MLRGKKPRRKKRKARTLDAARRERQGQIVRLKADGTPFDHVDKVQKAQRGILNQIDKLKKTLETTPKNSNEADELNDALSVLSKLLDKSSEFCPRPTQ